MLRSAPVRMKYVDPATLGKLGNLELVARCVVEGFYSGLHPSPFHGISVEYSEHRAYEPGDDLRFLDWKAYGRSDRLTIKKFQQETNVPVYILLDSSASMGFQGGSPVSKFEYGSFLAASLSYLMLNQGDSVGLTLFAERSGVRIPPRSRRSHLHAVLAALQNNNPKGQTHLTEVLHAFAQATPRRGIVMLISDMLDDAAELSAGLAHLRYLRHDVILFHTLDPQELRLDYEGLIEFEDLETGGRLRTYPNTLRDAYQERVNTFIEDIAHEAGRSGMDYILMDTEKPLALALPGYLAKRRRAM